MPLFLVRFTLPDGEHLIVQDSADDVTAHKHARQILGRRRADFPDEQVTILSVTPTTDSEVEAAIKELAARYPDRPSLDEQFGGPNLLLHKRVTPGGDDNGNGNQYSDIADAFL